LRIVVSASVASAAKDFFECITVSLSLLTFTAAGTSSVGALQHVRTATCLFIVAEVQRWLNAFVSGLLAAHIRTDHAIVAWLVSRTAFEAGAAGFAIVATNILDRYCRVTGEILATGLKADAFCKLVGSRDAWLVRALEIAWWADHSYQTLWLWPLTSSIEAAKKWKFAFITSSGNGIKTECACILRHTLELVGTPHHSLTTALIVRAALISVRHALFWRYAKDRSFIVERAALCRRLNACPSVRTKDLPSRAALSYHIKSALRFIQETAEGFGGISANGFVNIIAELVVRRARVFSCTSVPCWCWVAETITAWHRWLLEKAKIVTKGWLMAADQCECIAGLRCRQW